MFPLPWSFPFIPALLLGLGIKSYQAGAGGHGALGQGSQGLEEVKR